MNTEKPRKPLKTILTVVVIAALAVDVVFALVLLKQKLWPGSGGFVQEANVDDAAVTAVPDGETTAPEKTTAEPTTEAPTTAEPTTDPLSSVRVGETVVFGKYEQDGDAAEKEPIVWRVLAKEDGRVLVVSEYALDWQQFHTEAGSVTWEDSFLRDWLETSFIPAAFTKEEQTKLAKTRLKGAGNADFGVPAGAETTDRVFLLSLEEASAYFKDNSARRCRLTQYAIDLGASTVAEDSLDGAPTTWWWLRSPGHTASAAACVSRTGGLYPHGGDVGVEPLAVRPAMWLTVD